MLVEIRFHNCTSEVILAAVWFNIFPPLLSLWFVNLLRKQSPLPLVSPPNDPNPFYPLLPVRMLQPSAQKLFSFSLVNCVISLTLLLAPPPPVCLPLLSLSVPLVASCLDSWVGERPNLLLFPLSHGSGSSAAGGSAAAIMDRAESFALWHETLRTPLPSNPPPPTVTPPGHGRQHGFSRAPWSAALFGSALICRADRVESSEERGRKSGGLNWQGLAGWRHHVAASAPPATDRAERWGCSSRAGSGQRSWKQLAGTSIADGLKCPGAERMSPSIKNLDCFSPMLCHCKVACTNSTISLMFGCKVGACLNAWLTVAYT